MGRKSLCLLIITSVCTMINGHFVGGGVITVRTSNFPSSISTKDGNPYQPSSIISHSFNDLGDLSNINGFNSFNNLKGFGGFIGSGSGFSSFGSLPGFGALKSFGNGFHRFGLGGFDPFSIQKSIEESFKPMRLAQARSHMQSGSGGVTIIESPGKTLLKKDGVTLECFGQITNHQPFCTGQLQRFHIKNRQDFCYSQRYSQQGNVLCIGHNDQNGISFINNNGHYTCSGSDERPTLLITLEQYQQMCGKVPWETTYHYFPDQSHPFHVQLPNPDLGCTRADVCDFRPTPQSLFK